MSAIFPSSCLSGTMTGSLWIERLAGIRRNLHQQGFFPIDKVAGVERGELKSVAVRDGVRGACLHAITAEDAAVIVDVIDLKRNASSAADALFSSVLSAASIYMQLEAGTPPRTENRLHIFPGHFRRAAARAVRGNVPEKPRPH